MAERIGRAFYRLSVTICVVAIGAAAAWNGGLLIKKQDARNDFTASSRWLQKNSYLLNTPEYNGYRIARREQNTRLEAIVRQQAVALDASQGLVALAVFIFGIGLSLRENSRRQRSDQETDFVSPSRRWQRLVADD